MNSKHDYKAEGDIPNTRDKRLFLTGASGLLGRAVMQVFQEFGWIVYGTALTRVTPELHQVDLTSKLETENALLDFKPTFLIHCAAQRYPEKVEADYEAAAMLNVGSTEMIAKLCHLMGVPMLYISTDYVFDGTTPPYFISDEPNPLNLYGKTKLLGEKATLECGTEAKEPDAETANIVLRIPVLYGRVERLEESAVTSLLIQLLDDKHVHSVSDRERRRPSHVRDVAKVCHLLALKRFENSDVHGIFHWCGAQVLTKYGMIKLMADIFNLSYDHIIAQPGDGPFSITDRPYDCTLDTTSTLLVIGSFATPDLRSHLSEDLAPWVAAHLLQNP